jgi:hypothetical protein
MFMACMGAMNGMGSGGMGRGGMGRPPYIMDCISSGFMAQGGMKGR